MRLDATTGAELETIAYDPKSNTAGILLDDDTKEVRGAGRECPREIESFLPSIKRLWKVHVMTVKTAVNGRDVVNMS